ncbi:hypothetical protein BDV95DRAFT_158059 [Massariosphaeria phaeospora]|uniref:LysM domain-containing protein n=1 Tax=Massariosphaeria phaeospora TaxID=100035 RepID=A0A7C8M7P0_9PLEO|nr:hypothetical protein BDV95DRAFT_158059 [Massariosphaeria phaeospora]
MHLQTFLIFFLSTAHAAPAPRSLACAYDAAASHHTCFPWQQPTPAPAIIHEEPRSQPPGPRPTTKAFRRRHPSTDQPSTDQPSARQSSVPNSALEDNKKRGSVLVKPEDRWAAGPIGRIDMCADAAMRKCQPFVSVGTCIELPPGLDKQMSSYRMSHGTRCRFYV